MTNEAQQPPEPTAKGQANAGELSDIAKAVGILAKEMLVDNKNQRWWRNVRSITLTLFLVSVVIFDLIWAGVFFGDKFTGWETDKIVAIKIEGVIGERGGAADAIVPALNKAFDDKNVKAIILAIDSPGGHPGDADRISSVIERRKKETKKEVIAVIGGMGASAAYIIAVHADKIVAGKYSLVGSIGAVLEGWDFHGAMEKIGIKSRSYASGKLKTMLNPYLEMSPEANAKAQEIVDRMAGVFIQEVKDARKGKLKEGDLFTGEVWSGNEALQLGLIDEVATIDDYAQKTWGKEPVIVTPEFQKSLFSMSTIPEMLAEFVK